MNAGVHKDGVRSAPLSNPTVDMSPFSRALSELDGLIWVTDSRVKETIVIGPWVWLSVAFSEFSSSGLGPSYSLMDP